MFSDKSVNDLHPKYSYSSRPDSFVTKASVRVVVPLAESGVMGLVQHTTLLRVYELMHQNKFHSFHGIGKTLYSNIIDLEMSIMVSLEV